MSAGKPIIGLAGGIGSGKTTVASILADWGAAVIASDRLSHEELDSPEILAQLREWWGDTVIGPDGRADRGAIRRQVTGDPAARERLEQLLHPRVARRRRELMREYESDPNVPAIVWDSPLLFEAGLAEQCDYVIFVEADRSVRQQRVCRDRGWTPRDLENFEESQAPLEDKRRQANCTIVNNSSPDSLRQQVEAVLARIVPGNG